jgi:hypothetical protein
MVSGKIFRRGVPVGPDVDALMEAFDLKVGDNVTNKDISRVLREDHGSSRYKTVITSWRKRLAREKNFELKADHVGIGYTVISDVQKMTERNGELHKWFRGIGRTAIKTDNIDTTKFSDEEKKSYNLLRRAVVTANDALRQSVKEIAAPSEAKALPRLRSVNGDKK